MEKTMDKKQDVFGGARGSDGKLYSEYDKDDIRLEGREIIVSYLEHRGYEVLDAEWSCPFGKAILATKDGNDPDNTDGGMVLVEVDARLRFGASRDTPPDLNIDEDRMRRLKSMCLWYLAHQPDLPAVRADVIAIDIIEEHTARVRHLVSAFHWEE